MFHIPRKTKCIDDTLLWSDYLERSFWQAVDWLDVCRRYGITLNSEKFVIDTDTVPFAGFKITQDTHNFPTLSFYHTITDVRSWFGLMSQVSYMSLPPQTTCCPSVSFSSQTRNLDGMKNWINSSKNLKQVIAKEIEEGIAIFGVNPFLAAGAIWQQKQWSKKFNKIWIENNCGLKFGTKFHFGEMRIFRYQRYPTQVQKLKYLEKTKNAIFSYLYSPHREEYFGV